MTQPARRPSAAPAAAAALSVWLLCTGCTPALDWREARPEGSGVAMLFPCRPDQHQRDVRIAATTVRMRLSACKAAGLTYSLATAEAADPAQVTPLLAALREQTVANVAGKAVEKPGPAISGATPNPESRFVRIDGRYPDGRPVVEHAAFFVKGLRLYQATVIGDSEPPGADSLDSFFGAIRVL
jgi:hypothetical protein